MSRDNDGFSDIVEAESPKTGGKTDKLKRYQRLLIPANIVVIIIALVVFIAQLCMPMLKFEITITGEEIAQIIDYVQEQDESIMDSEYCDDIKYITQDVDSTVTISLYAIDALLLGPVPDAQTVRDFLTQYVVGMENTIDDVFADMLPRLTVYMVSTTIQNSLDSAIDIEQLESVNVEQIQAVTEAITSGNYEEAREQFSTVAQDVAVELGYELEEEDLNTIMEYYDEAIAAGSREDGSFSFVQALRSLAEKYGIDLSNFGLSATGSDKYLYYGSGVLATASTETDSDVETDGTGGDSVSSIDPVETIESYIDSLSDELVQIIGTSLFFVAAVFIGFTSLMWVILAVVALEKIFRKDKRFSMWYVKLFCWLPCVVFVAAPMFAISYLPNLIGGVITGQAASLLSIVSGIPMSFGGSGIVSGICLAVLWVVSIFWLFPIKHKIRKILNNIS